MNNWHLIETFLRVAEAGSLTAAAEHLGSSQPTVTRELRSLEEQLGVSLFVRHARGVSLSERGAELLPLAEEIDEKVQLLLRRAAGLRQDPEGTVRISANEPIALYALPPALAELRSDHPKLKLEIVVDNSAADLSRREADLAVRMFRPEQPGLVALKVADLEVGLYASERYLRERGTPESPTDIGAHTLIGFDRGGFWRETLSLLGLRPDDFAIRTDSMLLQARAMQEGAGIGALHIPYAQRHPELRRVLETIPLPPLGIWLVYHEDLRGNPALRVVLNTLQQALRRYADLASSAAAAKGT